MSEEVEVVEIQMDLLSEAYEKGYRLQERATEQRKRAQEASMKQLPKNQRGIRNFAGRKKRR